MNIELIIALIITFFMAIGFIYCIEVSWHVAEDSIKREKLKQEDNKKIDDLLYRIDNRKNINTLLDEYSKSEEKSS